MYMYVLNHYISSSSVEFVAKHTYRLLYKKHEINIINGTNRVVNIGVKAGI